MLRRQGKTGKRGGLVAHIGGNTVENEGAMPIFAHQGEGDIHSIVQKKGVAGRTAPDILGKAALGNHKGDAAIHDSTALSHRADALKGKLRRKQ